MKALILLTIIFSSVGLQAKCLDIDDSVLTGDQIIVKRLLISAYKYQRQETLNKDLIGYTNRLKLNYTNASEFLNEKEVSSLIIEQDVENKICKGNSMIDFEELNRRISDRIVDTYYGCGCEH